MFKKKTPKKPCKSSKNKRAEQKKQRAAFVLIQLWPAFQGLPWGLAQVVPPRFQHTEVQFLSFVPSTDGAAALQGERIDCPCMWASINKSPAFLGRTVLTEQFPGVGKAGARNRGYKQGRARKKPQLFQLSVNDDFEIRFFALQNHNTVR